jgi:hypothetical protein
MLLQKHLTISERNYLHFDMDIWGGVMNVAEEVKCDVVKAASYAELITTVAKLMCVAKLILDRIFASNESSGQSFC